ncbi:MAG TPA: adenine phosphoribosyltransferase [Clostridia bacterium]|nr:adenine phosphoribosyltransferase [Clostridia bacterium]
MNLEKKLRHIQNFPKDGIDFIDITTVLQDGEAFVFLIDLMKEKAIEFGDFDLIIGSESRGFIFGTPLAYALKKGFVPIRKKGKLPYKKISVEYDLEYGTDILEMHEDAVKEGQRVLIVDDLLATGGTCESNIKLIEKLGGVVAGILFFIELTELRGIDRLKGYNVKSLVKI